MRGALLVIAALVCCVSCQPHPTQTPLHHHAARGDTEKVLKLLEEGADPNAPIAWKGNVNDGATPLHLAINKGKVKRKEIRHEVEGAI